MYTIPPVLAARNTVKAKMVVVTPELTAYGAVIPVSTTKLRAADTGVIQSLTVFPGQAVHAGQKLATLRGPEIRAQLSHLQARVSGDHAALRSARQADAAERQKFRLHLATRKDLYQAVAAVSQAKASLTSAKTALKAAETAADIVAPADGVVASLDVTDGERVEPGQILMSVQTRAQLWLRALYYGSRSRRIHVGMRGEFRKFDGGRLIPVVVVSIGPVLSRDGGLPVRFRPISPNARWRSGDYGTVRLNSHPREVVVVPTRALILDQGQWWVLLRTVHGDRRQHVVIGSSRGFDTEIESGLKAGARVVVNGAYLEFHQAFAKHYQPPD